MRDYTPQILRAIRKYYGVNQAPFSEVLEVKQGTLSKIEAGQLEISARQWINVCTKYHLDPNIITTGRIEALENIKINPISKKRYGNFKVDSSYQLLMGSTVRTVYPILKFMASKVGTQVTAEFLKSKKIDPDYFIIQNLPINIKIIEDIFNFLNQRALISIGNVKEILTTTRTSEVHGYALSQINTGHDDNKNFQSFTKKISQLYEDNSTYSFEGDKKCYIRATDNETLKALNIGEEFNQFRSIYNLSHFNNLSPVLFSDKRFKVQSTDKGWNIAVA